MIRCIYGNTSKAKEAVRSQSTHNENAKGRQTITRDWIVFQHLKTASAPDFEGMKPNYAGSITIVNDESDIVFERELTHDEMIEVLLKAPVVEPKVEAIPAPKNKSTKGCSDCGSMRRHKKDCRNANRGKPAPASVRKSLDEEDQAWREFEPAITPLQFSEIKDLAIEQAMNSVEIIGEMNLPADQLRDVNFVIQSRTYQTYLSLARKAALG